MITYKIHLIRHGKTQGAKGGLYLGRNDVPLSAEGEKWLEKMKAAFTYPPVARVYTSPLKRCVQTAGIIYPYHNPVISENFTECDFGEFTSKKPDELDNLPAYKEWISGGFEKAPPEGESGVELLTRAINGLQNIFSDMMRQRATDVAVITHGGLIMSLLSACGLPKREMREWLTDFGCGFTIIMTPQMWMRDRAFEVYAEIPWRNTDYKFTDSFDVLDGINYEKRQ